MKELKLLEVDIEEKKYNHNMNLIRFFALISILITLTIVYNISEETNKFVQFSSIFLIYALIIVVTASLYRMKKLRRHISVLFNKKRKLIKNQKNFDKN